MSGNTPKIRFKGYTNAWEQRKLGEVAEISSASRVHKDEWTEDGVPFFRSSDVVAAYNGNQNEKAFISYSLYEDLAAKSGKVQTGDLLITGGGSIAVPYIVPDDNPIYFKDADLIWLKLNERLNGLFLYFFFSSPNLRKHVSTISHVGTISHYTIEQVKATPSALPALPEQAAIGAFFRILDDTIAIQKRKVEGLKKLKRAYLQQMFPQAGESAPRVRFEGFTGAWVRKNAADIFDSLSDKNHAHLPVLSASQEKGMVPRDEIGIDIKFDKASLSSYKRIKPGQFAIHLRSFQGGFAHSHLEGITSPAYTILDFKNAKEHDSSYWKEIFASDTFIKRLETITYGIRDGRSISFSEFSTLAFEYPSIIEQTAIGNFFRRMDEQIFVHQQKLSQLQQLKAAYLQNMFV